MFCKVCVTYKDDEKGRENREFPLSIFLIFTTSDYLGEIGRAIEVLCWIIKVSNKPC